MSINCPRLQVYVVKSSDNIYLIARRFNTTVDRILSVNPNLTNPNFLRIGQHIYIPVLAPVSSPINCTQPNPPVLRPYTVILSPTAEQPYSKGMVFIEREIPSVFGLITNVPDPSVFPGNEVYKLWLKSPAVPNWVVTTMTEPFPAYWVGLLRPNFPLSGATVVISAETRLNTREPAGLRVAVGTI